tara:strand:+ start:113 stop:640 length:528 start_codon:yes stop_codon:yes gene_type:complete
LNVNLKVRLKKIFLPAIVVVILDQLSKKWIDNNYFIGESNEIIGSILKFTYVKNVGMAFGITVGPYGKVITILSLVATLIILQYLWNERNNHKVVVFSLSIILGGALGNLIDRSLILFVDNYVGVTDFIDIGYGYYRWYIFNIADTSVTIGIILYFLHSIDIFKKINYNMKNASN